MTIVSYIITVFRNYQVLSNKSLINYNFFFQFHGSEVYFSQVNFLVFSFSSMVRLSAIISAPNFSLNDSFRLYATCSNVLFNPITLAFTSLIILSLIFSDGIFNTENIFSTLTSNNIVPCWSSMFFFLV